MFKGVLIVLVSSMVPIVELRGGIPLGVAALDLSPAVAFMAAYVGTMVPVLILLLIWPLLGKLLVNNVYPFDKILHWLFERTRQRFYARYRRFGNLALVLFVAIPLPITGVWTGSLVAYLFGIPYWRAAGLIALGALISGIIVLLATLGIILLI